MSDTQTTPYISMKQLERTPVRSRSTPNMNGRRNPPRPPARPTIPDTTPMLSWKSSPMYLNTDALPNAQATPIRNMRKVNIQTFKPMWKVAGPLTVVIVMSVCGYESRNRQIQESHSTHHVTLCAPQRSDIQPP